MMQPISAAILCLLSPALDGVRKTAKGNQSDFIGKVSGLYTFGAPHVSSPALFEDDCMDGYRIITYQNTAWYSLNKEDLVPTLLVPTKYDHPNIKTMKLEPNKKRTGGKKGSEWKCGDNPTRLTTPDAGLHDKNLYLNIMRNMPASHVRPQQAATVGLRNSYETDVKTVKANLVNEGFRLVGRAVAGEDVVNLMQDERSSRCIITFEGSDSVGDWMDNLNIDRVGFCGLKARVHKGFKTELMRVIASKQFQDNVRPKLGRCASLDVTGHSLGGATASLFTACVNNGRGGEKDQMYWNHEYPELMISL